MISSLYKNATSCARLAELIFFPSFCELCSSLLELPHEKVICRTCLQSLKLRHSSFCLCCGRFFDDTGEPHLCQKCLQKRPTFSCHRSCGQYNGKLKDVILLFKYRKFMVLGKDLAWFAYRTLRNEEALWWGVEAVVPVPLHPKRKKQRGFNQALIIAKELAMLKGIKLVEGQLVKLKNILPQTSLKAEDRQKNVKGAFGIKEREKIEGKIILLVDDVYTTGSTIRECSSVLKNAGAKDVRAITLARA